LKADSAFIIIHPMSRVDKILEKMRNNPLDWRIDNLKTVARAKREGVSPNDLVTAFLAEALGKRESLHNGQM
jgi:hypothetical protein